MQKKKKKKKSRQILMFQLNRFTFDLQKKKLNKSFSFPEVLNMSPFLGEDQQQNTEYKLCGILVHKGTSAHSGHYISYVFDDM